MTKTGLGILLALPMLATSAYAYRTASPNGAVVASFNLENGVPTYSVDYKGSKVILPSRMGFQLAATDDLTDGFSVIGVDSCSFSETWHPVWGENSDICNNYNEFVAKLRQDKTGRRMDVRFRVYDDGVGFRYEFPQEEPFNFFILKDERTEFAMPGDLTAWWIPGDYDTQEYEYNESRLSQIREIYPKAVAVNLNQKHPFSPTGVQTSLQMKTDDGIYIGKFS